MLYNDDCLKILPTLPDKSIDLICTDLPYAVTTLHWDSMIPLEPLWKQFRRISKGNIILFGQGIFSAKLIMSAPDLYKYTIIWDKIVNSNSMLAKVQPLRIHEDILIFANSKHYYNPQMQSGKYRAAHRRDMNKYKVKHCNGWNADPNFYVPATSEHYPKSIWSFPKDPNRVHPTQKPVELLAELILTFSQEGDCILDATMGSGTTGIACKKTKREFIGIEMDPDYFQVAKDRIDNTQEYLF